MKIVFTITLSFVFLLSYSQTFIEQSKILGINENFGFPGGGGISVADFNNDGFDDVTYCTTLGKNVIFYENT